MDKAPQFPPGYSQARVQQISDHYLNSGQPPAIAACRYDASYEQMLYEFASSQDGFPTIPPPPPPPPQVYHQYATNYDMDGWTGDPYTSYPMDLSVSEPLLQQHHPARTIAQGRRASTTTSTAAALGNYPSSGGGAQGLGIRNLRGSKSTANLKKKESMTRLKSRSSAPLDDLPPPQAPRTQPQPFTFVNMGAQIQAGEGRIAKKKSRGKLRERKSAETLRTRAETKPHVLQQKYSQLMGTSSSSASSSTNSLNAAVDIPYVATGTAITTDSRPPTPVFQQPTPQEVHTPNRAAGNPDSSPTTVLVKSSEHHNLANKQEGYVSPTPVTRMSSSMLISQGSATSPAKGVFINSKSLQSRSVTVAGANSASTTPTVAGLTPTSVLGPTPATTGTGTSRSSPRTPQLVQRALDFDTISQDSYRRLESRPRQPPPSKAKPPQSQTQSQHYQQSQPGSGSQSYTQPSSGSLQSPIPFVPGLDDLGQSSHSQESFSAESLFDLSDTGLPADGGLWDDFGNYGRSFVSWNVNDEAQRIGQLTAEDSL
uniref:ARAD1D09724p n=1 Tax=Blastobotrys adeninivorans TaxID=409370 RepID=A0A060T8B0_BLAAD